MKTGDSYLFPNRNPSDCGSEIGSCPRFSPDTPSGIYLLLLDVPLSVTVRVGALGELPFPAGRYAYVGSARRGLRARLARHARREKPLRWHVDYLRMAAEPAAALVWSWRRGRECWLARSIVRLGLGRIAAPRFGSSDCGCAGHLLVLTSVETGIMAIELAAALGEAPSLWSLLPGDER